MSETAVIVPFGRPEGEAGAIREGVWRKLRIEWENTGCNLIVSADPQFRNRGKFSVSRAINSAVRHAPPEFDRFVCFGADMLPSVPTVEWAATELETEPWTLLFDRGASVSEAGTKGWVVAGHEFDHPEPEVFSSPCVGPIAFTRRAFERVGGFDERYEGWAYEDVDFWYRLQRDTSRTKPQTYPGTELIQFWHPQDHHDLTSENPNVRLFSATW